MLRLVVFLFAALTCGCSWLTPAERSAPKRTDAAYADLEDAARDGNYTATAEAWAKRFHQSGHHSEALQMATLLPDGPTRTALLAEIQAGREWSKPAPWER